ncbi:MAG: cytochrome [Chthoniobacteraceae bacterium]|nr:cytochrome [Chthoniobacteraceae bacterium]
MAHPPRAPGPRGLPITGSLWRLSGDALGFLGSLEERYGAVVQARIGHLRYHLISDPELIEQVLWRRADCYTRASPSNSKLTDITGSSLLTTVGGEWHKRRKLIAPFFSRERMSLELPTMIEMTSRHLSRWREPAQRGEPVSAMASIMGLTCAIVSKVLFGTAVEDPALEQALADILLHHWRRLKDPLELLHRFPTQSRKAFDAGNQLVAQIVEGVSGHGGEGTLLEALRAAAGEKTGIQIEDELITLLIAGHETTANALIWAMHLLANSPAIQEQLRAEALEADHSSGTPLPIATRVFQESLRLYPPIWIIEREALVEDELGGFRIPAQSSVLVAPWVMHRSRRFWTDPDRFEPERFLSAPAKHVYIPFGIGPHACVGVNLALMEGPLLLSLAARAWKWRGIEGARVAPQPGLTLRMREPLRLLVEPVQ